MSKRKKFALIAAVIVVLLAVVGFSIQQSHKGVVAVETGKVQRKDLTSVVTASGEIKPKVYVNIGANAFAKITHLYVKEGDRVKRGQMLAVLDNVQPSADVSANDSALKASRTDAIAAQAAVNTAVADLNSNEASLDHAKSDYERNKALYDQQLIAKSDYDVKKTAYDTAVAQVGMSKAKLAQAKASLDSAQGHINQNQAMLRQAADVLSKTEYEAPFDGIITNVPVREGETVVPGIQNSPGSTLMTIGDTSVITAEVRVDESDIVNVQLGQPVEVTIDAMPKQKFKGKVTEIGRNALLRSTGVSTAQTTSSGQEAKDFKVIVALDNPPSNVLPGLSATARITTAKKENVLSIPIQALTIRSRGDLTPETKDKQNAVQAATPGAGDPKEDLQGVFIIRGKNDAAFVPVTTGISGTTDIEVNSGLKEGDEIVTGSYKILRTLKNGARVKIDNSVKSKPDEEAS
jgi:HlyD family secretion protein